MMILLFVVVVNVVVFQTAAKKFFAKEDKKTLRPYIDYQEFNYVTINNEDSLALITSALPHHFHWTSRMLINM